MTPFDPGVAIAGLVLAIHPAFALTTGSSPVVTMGGYSAFQRLRL